MYNYNKMEQKIADELIKLGFHISSKGFNYLVTGTILVYNSDDDIGICKIYEIIARRYYTTPTRVERAIRSDIIAYYDDVLEVPSLLIYNPHTGKLTNKELLYRLAYMFRDILKENKV